MFPLKKLSASGFLFVKNKMVLSQISCHRTKRPYLSK